MLACAAFLVRSASTVPAQPKEMFTRLDVALFARAKGA